MRVCVLQPPYPEVSSKEDAGLCVQWMKHQLDACRPREQDLIVLPEYANVPGLDDAGDLQTFAENEENDLVAFVAESSARLSCLIAVGSVVKTSVGWQNQVLVYEGKSAPIYVYNKVHLTDVESETLGLVAGNSLGVFHWQGIRFGFAVCFDMYFSAYFEALAKKQVDLIVCPGYQRSESGERIRLLSGARALDSGAYVIRSSYAMRTPNKGGHSLVASPDGNIVVDAGDAAGVLFCDIDPKVKFMKPASHGQAEVVHRALIEAHLRPEVYAKV